MRLFKGSRPDAGTIKAAHDGINNNNALHGHPSTLVYHGGDSGATHALPKMLSLREAAEETGLSYGYLRGLCLSGTITCLRAGRTKWLINASSLAAFLNGGGVSEQ